MNGEEIFGGGTPENCVSSNDGSSQNNLSANAVCLKSSVQQNQIIRQEWSNGGGMTAQSNSAAYQQAQQKPVVSSAVLDTYQTLKSQFGELEREQQVHITHFCYFFLIAIFNIVKKVSSLKDFLRNLIEFSFHLIFIKKFHFGI